MVLLQPQVPLRLRYNECTRVTYLCMGSSLLAINTLPSDKDNSNDVAISVYKARERIHRGMLIHDY